MRIDFDPVEYVTPVVKVDDIKEPENPKKDPFLEFIEFLGGEDR